MQIMIGPPVCLCLQVRFELVGPIESFCNCSIHCWQCNLICLPRTHGCRARTSLGLGVIKFNLCYFVSKPLASVIITAIALYRRLDCSRFWTISQLGHSADSLSIIAFEWLPNSGHEHTVSVWRVDLKTL